ncbi:unnamed protein product [Notodromas monacha]|uniref:Uncharacterized protein n=1 Tax=Notodromas monacha TaxID=399045 RepID=A0A7R9BLR6_9CRUS|nr:unnamed protein product [Notodromas monacha]CAG0917818.1 unnamed protein product [Notodromas monacha]
MLRSVSEFMRDAALTVKSGSWIKQKQFRFVVGNEACDLDSAVCAVARGLLLADVLEGSSVEKRVCAAPVLNIPRSELCLKTEVVFWFQDNGIEPDSFICW